VWRIAAALFLSALFGLQFYRAATQSITIDEAHIYLDFIRPNAILNSYEAGHHILQTYLSWYFSRRWGGSELVLRIPALLACIGWFAFAYRFSSYLFGRGALFFAGVLALASNPLLLDHLTLARGYGLAAAFFGWALYASIRFVETSRRNFLTAAGVLSALAVASNLTFLLAVCGVATAILSLRLSRRGEALPKVNWLNDYFGPAVVVGILIVMLPLTHVNPGEHYYYGASTLADSARSLMLATFDRRWNGPIVPAVGYGVAAVAFAAMTAGIWFAVRRRQSNAGPVFICAISLATGILAAIVAHYVTRTPYPMARTGMWIYVLLSAGALSGCAAVISRFPRASSACATGLFALGAAYLWQYDTRYVLEWREDAAIKQFMADITKRESGRNREYTVAGPFVYMYPADYYRIRWKVENMRPMSHGGAVPGADYYVLQDRPDAERLGASILEERLICRCLLAAR
jgi:hypothetical protein